jgi:hypothetical protein
MNGDDEDDWDDDESLPKDIAYPFSDADWTLFDHAVSRIRSYLSLSIGAAEKTLRDLCADGTVRSVRRPFSTVDQKWVGPAAIIRPSEWVKDNVDFEVTDEIFIGVSEDDLNHWLDKQAMPEKRTGKVPLVIRHLASLHPDGVPEPALAPRKALIAKLLHREPKLGGKLDEATLDKAIKEYNGVRTVPNRIASD